MRRARVKQRKQVCKASGASGTNAPPHPTPERRVGPASLRPRAALLTSRRGRGADGSSLQSSLEAFISFKWLLVPGLTEVTAQLRKQDVLRDSLMNEGHDGL